MGYSLQKGSNEKAERSLAEEHVTWEKSGAEERGPLVTLEGCPRPAQKRRGLNGEEGQVRGRALSAGRHQGAARSQEAASA